ncbi:Serine/threonine-protein kinase Nek5 [Balamuthia mandrillaris]
MKQKEFVKLFGVSEDEDIIQAFHCALKQKHTHFMEGNIYATRSHACFFASFFGRERKLVINWEDVVSLERKNTGGFIPNAIMFTMKSGEQYLFRFLNRHEAYAVMEKLWKKKMLNVQSGEISKLTERKNWNSELEAAMLKRASRYEVVDKLGEGSFGLTFVVLDKVDFRHYVLKEVCCETEKEAKEALKEMVLLRLLRHPYVVTYKDFWQQEMHVFIVMEYCQGGDVGRLIQKRKYIEEETILAWLCQMLLALAHMHSVNVLHRDIKPQNMFLNKWGDIKLGDFGLSTVRKDRKKQYQTAVGTLGYAGPELLKGRSYNEKSDMYALGTSLYEMMTLRSVYEDTKADIFPRPIPANHHYSEELIELMNTLIQREPDKRPSAKEVLTSAFLQPTLKRVTKQGEIYAELQQRDDENDQLRFKVQLLQQELLKVKPDNKLLKSNRGNFPLGLDYWDEYDEQLSMSAPHSSTGLPSSSAAPTPLNNSAETPTTPLLPPSAADPSPASPSHKQQQPPQQTKGKEKLKQTK